MEVVLQVMEIGFVWEAGIGLLFEIVRVVRE
jgi:hypothetical protein